MGVVGLLPPRLGPGSRALLHSPAARRSEATAASSSLASSNPAMAFPCLDKLETRSETLKEAAAAALSSSSRLRVNEANSSGRPDEPSYTSGATLVHHCREPLALDWGGILPDFTVAYETWGRRNADGSNTILLHTGLSASSHARSTDANPQPGWWERFIGPGRPLDTDRFHVICTNVVGGCYGSTGREVVPRAMDLFDLGRENQLAAANRRARRDTELPLGACVPGDARCGLTLPDTPYEEQPESQADASVALGGQEQQPPLGSGASGPPADLVLGLSPLRDTPTLVMGVASDILFPAWQQREIADSLRLAGSRSVTYTELSEEQSLFGHDTFLLDLENVGGNLRKFLG
ncbi:homoserine O-acetyltransferase [Ophiocordyceps sinensis CO18]|uniref:Homoserine O-acetyltransferase n=1 Tax=Ophiocordyceps sinensis (strain Co18 / CGMCC 3.14243) TaxID=911162 RepID=T5AEU0_OPHSC|nr:homoserine O-acetyltransferase [Ophiocordyceps sinensis CO18]